MIARRGVDELGIYPHAIATTLNASLHYIANVQLAPDLLEIDYLAFVCESRVPPNDKGTSDARKIGGQALSHTVDKIVLLRVAADIGEGQHNDGQARRAGPFRYGRSSRLRRVRRSAHFERIDMDRLGDVLELGCAEVGDFQVEPLPNLTVGVLRKTDCARLGDAFEPSRDIDAVAHQIAILLLDDISEMNADTKFDATLWRQPSVALDQAVLHLDGAAHGVDHA